MDHERPCALVGSIAAAFVLILIDPGCAGSKHAAVGDGTGGASGAPALGMGGSNCGLPTSFAWTSTAALLGPVSDATHNLVAIKDPSVVHDGDGWHVFASSVSAAGTYSIVYLNFPSWEQAADATVAYLDQTPGLAGYHAAPQVFFFAPQNKWYLIYQSGPPQYSTADTVGDARAWTRPANFYASEPATVTANKGAGGGWLDFWIICDTANCHMFFSDDNGHWYRSQTAIADFPQGFGEPVIVLQDADRFRLFEASNVYKIKGADKYLALVEGFDAASAYHRYFRSWTADTLDGAWTPLQDTYAASFASAANVTFPEQPAWSQDISHGEMVRDSNDQTLTIDTCRLQFLYQGMDPTMRNLAYNSLPWRLGLITKTN